MRKTATATAFTPGEREYVRRELDMFFSTCPTVAEGCQLKTWRGGPPAGAALDRGLMRLDAASRPPRRFFTDAGLVELRAMMADRRLTDPVECNACHPSPRGIASILAICLAQFSQDRCGVRTFRLGVATAQDGSFATTAAAGRP
jgi:hypothetical protein